MDSTMEKALEKLRASGHLPRLAAEVGTEPPPELRSAPPPPTVIVGRRIIDLSKGGGG